MIAPFVDALAREIEAVSRANPYPLVQSIYFGGGTPSVLTPEQFDMLIAVLDQQFDLKSDVEITVEVNPNDADARYLRHLRDSGVNRISFGMQSSNPYELRLFARRHDYATVIQSVCAAREAGYENTNLDLIYGFPNQTIDTWEESLEAALELNPEHISLYALGLERGTPMYEWVNNRKLFMPDEDIIADMYELATEKLHQWGYEQYEISNWSRPGYNCRHNLQYWHNFPYIGLGPGAHGYAAGVRYDTVLSPKVYITRMTEIDQDFQFPYSPATKEAISVDRRGEISDTLITNLRLTQNGIERNQFLHRFGVDIVDLYGATLYKFADFGLLEISDTNVRITNKGRLLSNIIFRELV